LEGIADHAWAVSFLVTNIPANDGADIVALEHWLGGRADIENQIKDHKLGAGLRHLPSADSTVNQVWTWAAILAGWLSILLQSLTGHDQHAGRAHGDRLRHELITIPGRVVRHAGTLTLRLPPGRDQHLMSEATGPAAPSPRPVIARLHVPDPAGLFGSAWRRVALIAVWALEWSRRERFRDHPRAQMAIMTGPWPAVGLVQTPGRN
jgi:hypothetical protein